MGILGAKFAVIAGLVALSLALVTGAVAAKQNDDGTRPGWGWGDQNHEHTGPPGGPSVHPVFGSVN